MTISLQIPNHLLLPKRKKTKMSQRKPQALADPLESYLFPTCIITIDLGGGCPADTVARTVNCSSRYMGVVSRVTKKRLSEVVANVTSYSPLYVA